MLKSFVMKYQSLKKDCLLSSEIFTVGENNRIFLYPSVIEEIEIFNDN